MNAIIHMIAQAAEWLRASKQTNQWARPWPDEYSQNLRIARGIHDGLTWIVEDNNTLVGTVTYRENGNSKLWTALELHEPAVYISRLIVTREYAGQDIGGAIIDWTGRQGEERWNARSIRCHAWTTNIELHKYLLGQGFGHVRTLGFENSWDFPDGALFEKPTSEIYMTSKMRFKEIR